MAKVMRAYKVRLYPNNEQATLIRKTIGCSRFIYNQALEEKTSVYESLKTDKEKLREHKYRTEKQYKEEFEWLKEVDSKALQQSRRDLDQAFQNWFNSLKGKRKGPRVGAPKFKSKKHGGSYRTLQGILVDFEKRKLRLPKLGWVNYKDNRKFPGRILSTTVRLTPSGKFLASILVEEELFAPPIQTDVGNRIGLDMSLSAGFVDNQGNRANFPKHFQVSLARLRKEQRKLSRKVKGSANFHKQRIKVAKLHEKVSNQRKDFLDKLSTRLVKENALVAIEDLNLKGMAQFNFGKQIAELGWAKFVSMLEYKSIEHGCLVVKADRWFASTKLCSECGHKESLTLDQREWTCPSCGVHHDRDVNSAINLLKKAEKLFGLEPGGTHLSLEESSKTRTSVLASA